MPADNPRIDDLRRRVGKDPASIAFAQLAEEYRRSGDVEEAVRVCRAGLEHHPNYVSARVTLGRALMELQQLDDAQAEFEQVLLVAPDNLVAVRSMAELYQLKGETPPDMSLAREVATQFAPPPLLVAPPVPVAPPVSIAPPVVVPVAPPPIPDVPVPVVETPAVPVLETPAPVPDLIEPAPELIEPAPEAPPPMPDPPLQVDEAGAFDADIALDLDAALFEPDASEPSAPAAPAELPTLNLDAAVAAFNEAFGVPSPVMEPEPPVRPEPQPEPEPAKDPVLSDLEKWLESIKADREERRIP